MPVLRLDHIAMSCTDLDSAAENLEDQLGVSLAPRGVHDTMGTHNRLLSLGPEIYFELIAIDPAAQAPDRPRWFDLDNFAGHTRLTNWIVATDDMTAALPQVAEGSGAPIALQRGDYRWSMAVPDSGLLPFGGWAPAIIEWQGEAHPAPALHDQGVRLENLTLFHPDAEAIAAIYAPLLPRDSVLFVPSENTRMEARLSTPSGDVTLV